MTTVAAAAPAPGVLCSDPLTRPLSALRVRTSQPALRYESTFNYSGGTKSLHYSPSWRFCELVHSKPCRSRWSSISVAMDASYTSDAADDIPGPPPVFNRIYVRDPFKRLGISHDASELEVTEARNFLLDQYGRHERSREAIEDAHDRIIFESFRVRKRSKINLKTNLKKKLDESPPWVRRVASFVEIPNSTIILQRAALYAAIGVWSVMNASEGGPAFQVFVALGFCIYFINDRLKSLPRACILGLGSLVTGWTLGSLVIPNLSLSLSLQRGSLELFTALTSYVFLWVACTFLK